MRQNEATVFKFLISANKKTQWMKILNYTSKELVDTYVIYFKIQRKCQNITTQTNIRKYTWYANSIVYTTTQPLYLLSRSLIKKHIHVWSSEHTAEVARLWAARQQRREAVALGSFGAEAEPIKKFANKNGQPTKNAERSKEGKQNSSLF